MSVVITVRAPGDTDQFRRFIQDEERLRAISDRARAQGCLAHRFAIGDGFVLVVDEWESAEQFQQFFASIPDVLADAGAQGAPDIVVAEAVTTADQF